MNKLTNYEKHFRTKMKKSDLMALIFILKASAAVLILASVSAIWLYLLIALLI